jgi:hypothetical protein
MPPKLKMTTKAHTAIMTGIIFLLFINIPHLIFDYRGRQGRLGQVKVPDHRQSPVRAHLNLNRLNAQSLELLF